MNFKGDESFLRYITMGALGTRAVAGLLGADGHRIIELERYCLTNKIWATKIKRLRVADLLCLGCGCRFEVRVKSDLAVKMSDSLSDATRRWDCGLRDEDVCAFIAWHNDEDRAEVAQVACYFSVGAMRRALSASRVGDPKSAAEGAERDRTWPTWTPPRDGCVVDVSDSSIRVRYDDGKLYTYRLSGKRAYCRPGERFRGRESILAGVIDERLTPRCDGADAWDIKSSLLGEDAVEQYAAVKALAHVLMPQTEIDDQLARLAQRGKDGRVALEAAASLAGRGDARGQALLRGTFDSAEPGDPLRMEVVLILTEIDDDWAAVDLEAIAAAFGAEEEVVAACVFGLGTRARPRPRSLLPFLAHPSEDVAIHAIVALSRCLSASEVPLLLASLAQDDRRAAAAAEVLKRTAALSVEGVCEAAFHSGWPSQSRDWARFILGHYPEALVRTQAARLGISAAELAVLSPLWRGLHGNWLAGSSASRLDFVARQGL